MGAVRGVGQGVALAAALLALAGCSTLPPAEIDDAALTTPLRGEDRFRAGAHAPQPEPEDLRWWARFDDPELARWVDSALDANLDVGIARERVAQAQALLQIAQARRRPQLSVQADATAALRRRGDTRALQPSATLALDFDIDLWGGLRQAERSAAAGVLRSQHLVQAARLGVAGLTARAYLAWRLAQAEHRLLQQTLALQQDTLRVVGVRVDAGLSPRLDRERARAELADTEDQLAQAAQRIAQAATALQVLAGRSPLHAEAAVAARAPAAVAALALPALRQAQPVVRPLDLLRLRPDLQAAEQALVEAAAEVGVAKAAMRPRLQLPGRLVFGAVVGGGVFELARATLAAALDQSLFDGGERSAEVDAARSRLREASLVYRQTLLQALQQVEDALVAVEAAGERVRARESGSAAAQVAVDDAQTQYRAGLVGFLDVIDAQRSALLNRQALLQAQADAALAAVAAFEAMGLIEGGGNEGTAE
ncbi:efflux transporter outer membrane subunit [Tepidimonas sp.]|uniref:efflux transporter outer membrane subunit n=1 Tax=Tepidimonas sp. TaxID=2002775 RepID=UPI0028CCE684|nr:efflux transporter outer membrane subunit [Tepidimonas sp.]MDT7928583.1 efflux transporter outer membrane subunit [Tepidimonas sp.]